MFDEFESKSARGSRAQFGGSLALALLLYGGAGAAIVAASSDVRRVIEEKLTQVEFAVAPPPEAKPEPPPPAAAPTPTPVAPRPKAKRPELKPPSELPSEKPPESDGPLAAAENSGPVDGFLDGVEGGRGTAPAPPPPPPPPPPAPTLVPPVALRGNEPPRYSTRARMAKVEGTVVVSFEVLEDGSVANARIVDGPRELHEAVLDAVSRWRFQPAKRGGVPVRARKTQSIVFRLEDA